MIINNDCLIAMKRLGDNSIDSVVTDPPYGISFMNKHWDYDVPGIDVWKEVLRVLKPGGHILCACGTRTQHRMTVNIEDAGFEIRDVIAWIYGSGFPKSLNIGKAIDKEMGMENIIGTKPDRWTGKGNSLNFSSDRPQSVCKITLPGTSEAQQYEGWGTALKPAMELWTLARKPLSEKTVATNVLKYGTGGINIDGCRVEYIGDTDPRTFGGKWKTDKSAQNVYEGGYDGKDKIVSIIGRFPANVIHDGSEEVFENFPDTKSGFMAKGTDRLMSNNPNKNTYGYFKPDQVENDTFGDSGSAARFFYCAKSSRSERNKGVEDFETKFDSSRPWCTEDSDRNRIATRLVAKQGKNNHPTVKPIALMRYLCKLITPKNGIVLDPYMGSGSTGVAAKLEGFQFIGIEREEEYCKIAQARIDAWKLEEEQKLTQKEKIKTILRKNKYDNTLNFD